MIGRGVPRAGGAIAEAPDKADSALLSRSLRRIGVATGVVRRAESAGCEVFDKGLYGTCAGGGILVLDTGTGAGVASLCVETVRTTEDRDSGTAEFWRGSDPGRVLWGLAMGLKTVPPFSEKQQLGEAWFLSCIEVPTDARRHGQQELKCRWLKGDGGSGRKSRVNGRLRDGIVSNATSASLSSWHRPARPSSRTRLVLCISCGFDPSIFHGIPQPPSWHASRMGV